MNVWIFSQFIELFRLKIPWRLLHNLLKPANEDDYLIHVNSLDFKFDDFYF